jgi:hypothetical protein
MIKINKRGLKEDCYEIFQVFIILQRISVQKNYNYRICMQVATAVTICDAHSAFCIKPDEQFNISRKQTCSFLLPCLLLRLKRTSSFFNLTQELLQHRVPTYVELLTSRCVRSANSTRPSNKTITQVQRPVFVHFGTILGKDKASFRAYLTKISKPS